MDHATLPRHDIVLLGAGHTNAHIVRMWRMKPIPDARLTCVSDFPVATYSGMMPGVLAGQYPVERMQIDLVRLCAAAGVRLICGQVERIECAQRLIYFSDRPALPFGFLSIGIGSRPRGIDQVSHSPAVLPIKPMQTFLDRLEQRIRTWLQATAAPGPLVVAVVGGGVAGIEIALCVPEALRRLAPHVEHQVVLIEEDAQIGRGILSSTRALLLDELNKKGTRVFTGKRVVDVRETAICFADGTRLDAAVVLWATGAEAAPILSRIDAQHDDRGFLLVRPTLQTLDHDHVFAVGDCATLADHPTAKAGVYAVRQGPILWENLQRIVRGEPLRAYKPQRNFLKLINVGDGRAVGEYRRVAFRGVWCWKLKDRIDTRFMEKYQNYAPRMPEHDGRYAIRPADPANKTGTAMRCLGCGGKVGSSVLSRVLARLQVPEHPQILLGLDRPDDAAVVRAENGHPISVTVDFFAPPFDDAYLVGRLAALNAASDCYAMGSQPFAALASITLPYGPAKQQEQLLYELLQGGLDELRRMGATLVGGHTIEGPQLTVGFTMLANQTTDKALTKHGLRPGDRLLLTKPLGIGVLLAGHMRALCRYDWYHHLLRWMLISNQSDGEFALAAGVNGLTDVTGFGLAGHLAEMLAASQVSAELYLAHIPLLPGAAELLCQGVQSTLAPDNRRWEAIIQISDELRRHVHYQALFDPQTCGGLLVAVPAGQESAWENYWQKQHGQSPWWIGRVVERGESSPSIRIVD